LVGTVQPEPAVTLVVLVPPVKTATQRSLPFVVVKVPLLGVVP
jgi:hypothetical protein